MIEIDGLFWFIGALIICGAHVLFLRSWRREHRQYMTWWQRYDAKSQRRYDELMRVMDRNGTDELEWNLDGNCERGQA